MLSKADKVSDRGPLALCGVSVNVAIKIPAAVTAACKAGIMVSVMGCRLCCSCSKSTILMADLTAEVRDCVVI